MANNFDKIKELVDAGNSMGLSNSIKRNYGIPLDYTSVQKDYAAAVEYAATNTLAYIGQPISVGDKLYIVTETSQGKYPAEVEEGQTQYDVFLAEVGSATEGDGTTIDLVDGILSLHGIDGKLTGTYVPSLVNGVLTWNEPDTSTAEGQQQAIDALETRADAIELTLNGKAADEEAGTEAIVGLIDKVAANTKAIDDEKLEREAAIGHASDDEVAATGVYSAIEAVEDAAKAYTDEKTTGYTYNNDRVNIEGSSGVNINSDAGITLNAAGIALNVRDGDLWLNSNQSIYLEYNPEYTPGPSEKAPGVYVNDERVATEDYVNNAITDSIAGKADASNVYTKTEVDGKITGLENTIAGITHFTTKVVSSTDEVTEVGILYLIKDESVAGVDKYNEYLFIEDLGAVLIGDTTTDLSDYVTNDALTTALAPYAKTADVVTNDEFTAFEATNNQAIADARINAVSDVAKVGYALEESVASRLADKADAATLNDYYTADQIDAKGYAVAETVNTELAKKVETAQLTHTTEGVGEGVTKVGTQLNIVVDAYRKSEVYTKSETDAEITKKITSINGGESAGEVKSELVDYRDALNAEIWGEAARSWTTKVESEGKTIVTYTPQYGSTSRVDTIEAKVGSEKSGETAATGLFAKVDAAQAKADEAAAAVSTLENGQVKTNKENIAAILTRVENVETQASTNKTNIATLTGTVNGLNTTVSGHTTKLTDIEAQLVVLGNKDTELDTAIKANASEIAKKANAADVYTKTEIDGKILTTGTLEHTAEGKAEGITISGTSISVVIDSYTKSEVDDKLANLDQSALETGIANNTADIAILVGTDKGEDGRAAKSVRAIALEEVTKLVNGAPEALDTLAEIADWIIDDNTGSAAVIEDIAEHEAILTGFGGDNQPKTVIAAIATAKQEAIDEAKFTLEVATADKLGGVKSASGDNKVSVAADGVMSVAAVNVNTLTQTTGDILILDGGSAFN